MACQNCGDPKTPKGQLCKPCEKATDKLIKDLKKKGK